MCVSVETLFIVSCSVRMSASEGRKLVCYIVYLVCVCRAGFRVL